MATSGTQQARVLPISRLAFGAIALGFFLVLLGVLWSFRNPAAKYDMPVSAGHGALGDRRGPHGATDHGAHH